MTEPQTVEAHVVARATFAADGVDGAAAVLRSLQEERFTGVVTVRMSQGGVMAVEAEGRRVLGDSRAC
jgi:hypothetical protein